MVNEYKSIDIVVGELLNTNKKYQTGRVFSHGYLEQRVDLDDVVYFEKQDEPEGSEIELFYKDIKGFVGPCKTCGKKW